MSTSVFRSKQGGRYTQIENENDGVDRDVALEVVDHSPNAEFSAKKTDQSDRSQKDLGRSHSLSPGHRNVLGSPSGSDADYQWRVSEDGTLKRFIRRDSVSLTSENEMHAGEEEVEIPALDLTAIPEVKLAPAPLTSSVWSRWGGFAMLALSAFFFSLMSLFVSMTGGRVNSFLLVWIRCISQFVLGCGALILGRLTQKTPVTDSWFVAIMGPKGKKRFLFARGFVGMFSLSCFYYGLTSLPLSEATVLFFTAPIYTGLIGRFLLHEDYDRWDALSCLTSFIGVIFVSRPAFLFGTNAEDGNATYTASQRAVGIVISLVGAFISAFVYLFIRKVGKGVNPLILVHYLGWIGMVGVPLTLIGGSTWSAPQGQDVGYIVAICVFAFCGQFLFNKGGALIPAGVSSLIRNLDIVFSLFWQLTVEHLPINGFSLIGAFIVTGSVVALGVRKWRKDEAAILRDRAAQEKVIAVEDESVELHPVVGETDTTLEDDGDLDLSDDDLADDPTVKSDGHQHQAIKQH